MLEILIPVLVAVSVVALLYRRVRRLFGKQRISTPRFALRILVSIGFSAFFFSQPGLGYGASMVGVGIGLLFAGVGVVTTRLEKDDENWYYVPNTYLGLFLVSLILGRLAYRLWEMRGLTISLEDPETMDLAMSPMGQALVMALLVYYGAYSGALLVRRSLQPQGLR